MKKILMQDLEGTIGYEMLAILFLDSAFDGEWPILFLFVWSSNWKCMVSLFIVGQFIHYDPVVLDVLDELEF